MMFTRPFAAAALLAALATPALADPIEGTWLAATGNTVRIAKCGGGFCMTVTSGERKGKSVGSMSGKDGSYSGSIIAEDGKKYSGTAKLTSPSSLTLRGCVAKVFCRSQTWKKA